MNFSDSLLEWYYVNHRKLPWRETKDPYAIWLSEVMLQQTQVDTVIDYYNRFLNHLPKIEDLANATEDQVYKLWEGLGYYSRAKNLMKCAKEVTARYNGEFPKDFEEMIRLPGIGPYTAGAVLSIAYNLPYPAVDGNVMRVLSRIYHINEDISKPKTREIFENKVMELLPDNRRHFNQALMELGATVCTPQKPKCSICPVEKLCYANNNQLWEMLPVKNKKIKKSVKNIAAAYITYGDEVFITKKTEGGLLNGLWGFPYVEFNTKDNPVSLIVQMLYKNYGLIVEYQNILRQSKHIFTHITWDITLYHFTLFDKVIIHNDHLLVAESDDSVSQFSDYININWVTTKRLNDYPFSTAFKKLLSN